MREDWREFLVENGAVIENGQVVSFGNPTRERRIVHAGTMLADLSHRGLIAVHGDDAKSFLLAQFTNDIKQISPQLSQINGYCTPKGRLLAIFHAFQRGDTFYLGTQRDRVEPVIKRLRMFVMRAKATLEDASDSLVHIGLAGPKAANELKAIFPIPEAVFESTQQGDVNVIRLPGAIARFEIIGPVDDVKKIWNSLSVDAAAVGADPWELTDILAGVPAIFDETVEEFVPQMVNLDVIGGLSFKKGCYPGQEIVARMHYLGKLKRRMYLSQCNATVAPRPGNDVYVADTENAEPQKAGKVVNAVLAQDKGYAILSVLEIAKADGPLTLGAPTGSPLTLMPLPYTVDS